MKNIYNQTIQVIIFFILLCLFSCIFLSGLDNGIYIRYYNKCVNHIEELTTTYDINDINVQYHDDIEDIQAQSGLYNTVFSSINVLDQNGNAVVMPYTKIQGTTTYDKPGTYVYGSSTYVPSYTDSIFLTTKNRENKHKKIHKKQIK